MSEFKRISVEDANAILASNPASEVVDIRDEGSFEQSHIPQATHLHGSNLQDFVINAEFDQPVLVYCYHGISSQSAAQMLVTQGFEQVYSVDGGYEAWRLQPPAQS